MIGYEWPEKYRTAFCVTLDVDAESPQIWRSRSSGIRGINQLEQRRFGLREGIHRMLDLLDRYGVKATCYVPAYEASTRPGLLNMIAKRGHDLGLHGYYHEMVADISREQFRETLGKAAEFFRSELGTVPNGYRAPSFEMTPWAFSVLSELGISHDSSLSGYDHPYTLNGVTEIPIQWSMDDAIFFRYTGEGTNDRWPPYTTASQIDSWLDMSEVLYETGGVIVPTFHPWVSGRAARLPLVEKMLRRFCSDGSVWKATVGEVAAWHQNSVNADRFVETVDIPELPAGWPGSERR